MDTKTIGAICALLTIIVNIILGYNGTTTSIACTTIEKAKDAYASVIMSQN